AHHGDAVAGIAGDVVVHLGDVFVLGVRDRAAEGEAGVVETVTATRAVRRRPGVEVGEGRGARTDMKRIELGELCGRQGEVALGDGIACAAEAGDAAARAGGGIDAGILDDAVLHRLRGNLIGYAGGFGAAGTFKIGEEEEAVFLNGPTEG